MLKKFLSNEDGTTLQIVGTTAGALAVCFMFGAAFLDKAVQSSGIQAQRIETMSLREKFAALPRAVGAQKPRGGQGIDYGSTASIPGIRNVVLDPCTGMPK